jgi:hypothetical protein
MAEDAKTGKTGTTGTEPSIEDLARRLMDLWQEQMAAVAADPDLMRQMAKAMAASPLIPFYQPMMQGMIQGMLAASRGPMATAPGAFSTPPAPNPFDFWKGDHGSAKPPRPGPGSAAGPAAQPAQQPAEPKARPTPAAPASEPGGDDLVELRHRLAGLEARLAKLGEVGREIAGVARSEHVKAEQPSPAPKSKPGKPRKRAAGKVAAAPAQSGGGESGDSGGRTPG